MIRDSEYPSGPVPAKYGCLSASAADILPCIALNTGTEQQPANNNGNRQTDNRAFAFGSVKFIAAPPNLWSRAQALAVMHGSHVTRLTSAAELAFIRLLLSGMGDGSMARSMAQVKWLPCPLATHGYRAHWLPMATVPSSAPCVRVKQQQMVEQVDRERVRTHIHLLKEHSPPVRQTVRAGCSGLDTATIRQYKQRSRTCAGCQLFSHLSATRHAVE
jgi:hypothetical protein